MPSSQAHRRRRSASAALADPHRVGAQQQPEAEHQEEDHQEVVVVTTQPPDQDDRVDADDHRGRQRIASEQVGTAVHEEHGREARDHQRHLHRPEGSGDAERYQRHREDREQRPVGAQQAVPVTEQEGRIGVRLERRDRHVRVEVVDGLHAPVVEVVEDVGQRQRRGEEEDHVNDDDRPQDPARTQARSDQGHDEVGDQHRRDRRREEHALRVVADREPVRQRTGRAGDPVWIVAGLGDRRRHEDPRACRGERDEQQAREDHQAKRG
jgi:hypothetical protein